MTTPTTITEAGFLAMVDFAAQPGNECALSNNKTSSLGEHMENQIVRSLFDRLELHDVLERVKHGHFSSNISVITQQVSKQGLKELHQLREHLQDTHEDWRYGSITMEEFAKTYWTIVLGDRIKKGNFRRAWDDIREMMYEDEPFYVKDHFVHHRLHELYKAMRNKRLPVKECKQGAHHFHCDTPLPGLHLILKRDPKTVIMLNGGCGPATRLALCVDSVVQPRKIRAGSYEFGGQHLLVFSLAEYFASERKKKRGRAAVRR